MGGRSSRAALAVALIAIVGLHLRHLGAQEPEAARALAARANERIRTLQREADRLAADARTMLRDLRQLEITRAIQREELARAEAKEAEVAAALDAATAHVSSLAAVREAGTPGVAERLVEIYKRRRGGYLRLLLSTDDLRALGRMSRGVAAVAAVDRVRLEAHRRALAGERAALADLARQQDELAAARSAAARARADLDEAIAARNTLIDDIDRRRDLTAQLVGELQGAQAALQRTLTAVASGAVPRLPLQPFRGALDWPVTGKVVSAFGRAPAGRFGTSINRNGIEISATEGTPARAVHDGVVAYAAPFSGFGTLVIVDHGGGAFSLYGHLLEARVDKGATVTRGSVVGTVGLAPAGGSALYFELRIDGRPVDPLQWLGRSR